MVRSPVFFHQKCPVCGRVVRVRVSLLGRQVFCQHCQGSFVASDSSSSDGGASEATPMVDDLLQRANELLSRVAGDDDEATTVIMSAGSSFQ
jgi:hypothetical protein